MLDSGRIEITKIIQYNRHLSLHKIIIYDMYYVHVYYRHSHGVLHINGHVNYRVIVIPCPKDIGNDTKEVVRDISTVFEIYTIVIIACIITHRDECAKLDL